ncbi:MAG: hypothetical protein EP329_27880 [Deltaproteobacteria bacterium]|nr:MAG: hypothetical protein EP329_27880 [Deltaproteobacteria bacterium]
MALLLALPALLGGAPPVRANFGVAGFETEEISAFTLRDQELKVGPAAVRFGLLGELQIGTSFALNLLGAFNADVKWRIFEMPGFAIAVETGVVHFDPGLVGVDTEFSVTALPAKLDLTFVASTDFQVHLRLDYLSADPDAQAPDSVMRVQRYLGPVGTFSGELFLEWRVGSHFALVLEYAIPFVMFDRELLFADEDPDDRIGMMRVAASLLATFDAFNVRVGVGYGPSFLGEQSVFPMLDLYWRVF